MRALLSHLQPDRSLAKECFDLVERVNLERTGVLRASSTRGERVRIELARDHQLRAKIADPFLLGNRRHRWNEDGRRNAEPVRRKGYSEPVIATRGCNYSRTRHWAREQVRKRAPRLEGAGVLSKLELAGNPGCFEPKICALDFEHRGAADMRTDQGVHVCDLLGAYRQSTMDACSRRVRHVL